MSRFRRVLGLVCVTAAFGLAVTACGKAPHYLNVVEQAMAATAAKSRAFVYTEQYQGATTTVQGVVADDFRYKALVSINHVPGFEEVVADDAIADRVLDPAALGVFKRKQAVPAPAGAAATAPDDTLSLLQGRDWVLDGRGAPSDLPSAAVKHVLGQDPIYDALTVFRYTDDAMHRAFTVVKFNKDSLDYKPKEDPFPQPKAGSGVVRYDLVLKKVPKASDISNGAQQAPDIADFRKMSIYVKDGLVIQILENVDVISRLNDLQKNYNLKFGTADPQRAASEAITAINAVDSAQGLDPIRVRTMSIKFSDVGRPQDVNLPDGTTPGSLTVLENRGFLTPQQQAASAQSSASPG